MVARHGRAVVFVLGPAELDRWPDGDIRRLDSEFATVKSPSLVALAGLLGGAVAYVGNDSGVSHLSAAVGAPSVALFGPTRAEHFAPLGPAVRVIQADRLADISPAEVEAAVERP